MRVAFLYNRSSEDPAHVAEDDVPNRSPVVAALMRLGHDVTPIACSLDLESLRKRLLRAGADVAFNRVESLGGSDAMVAAITMLLDSMHVPYTGCSTAALVATASKVAMKQRLVQAGLPTLPWLTPDREFLTAQCDVPNTCHSRYIIKAIYEHASFELGDASLVDEVDLQRISKLLREREAESGRPHFAEKFVEGREFNLSLIAPGPQVLPAAEIDFSAFPADKLHIVGHEAKCNYESFEYLHTERRFDFPPRDEPLIRQLKALATECWQLFELQGYARVDFRCDATGKPWILEINSNPCILPDAGFAAALEQAGIAYDDAIQQLLNDAIDRRPLAALARQPVLPLPV